MSTPAEVWHLLQSPVSQLPLKQLMGLCVQIVPDLCVHNGKMLIVNMQANNYYF